MVLFKRASAPTAVLQSQWCCVKAPPRQRLYFRSAVLRKERRRADGGIEAAVGVAPERESAQGCVPLAGGEA